MTINAENSLRAKASANFPAHEYEMQFSHKNKSWDNLSGNLDEELVIFK